MTRSRGAAVAGLVACLLAVAAVPAAAGAPAQRTWHAEQARVPDARAAGREGDGVVVAVIDSWVDGSHPDFEGRVLDGADCTSGTCRPGAAPDGCSHGTHVAGTVASSSYGVAPRARVLPVQVLAQESDGSCSGTTTGVAAGIRYAVTRGARVLNLSLGALVPGLSSSSAITGAVADAARAGAVVVFAAGNNSVPVADSYGGNALIVAATGPEGQLALYSQRGQGVTMAAPGGDPPVLGSCTAERCVTSLYPGGRYALAAGTSMAAPHVSGTAALLLAQDPTRTNQQVTHRLRATARPLSGAGSGALDATAALAAAPSPALTQAAPSTPVAPTTTSAMSPPASRPRTTAPPSEGAVATLPPVPDEALPLPGGEVAPVPAPDVGPEPATSAPPLAADPASGLPVGPPALAVALLLTAATATTLAGLRRPR